MRSGFLGGDAAATAATAYADAANPANAGAGPRPPPSPAAQLAEVLDLCRGPTDERRLVGLLLATKLLPGLAGGGRGSDGASVAADAAARLRSVCDAVGLEFLQRLLLPLSQPAQGGVEVRSTFCLRAGERKTRSRSRPPFLNLPVLFPL